MKPWREPSKPWYKTSEIRFSPSQVEWLLENLNAIKEGNWPPEAVETGYSDVPGVGKGGKKRAYFETPIVIGAEVDVRLEKCGRDGLLTRKCLCDGWDEVSVAELLNVEVSQVRRRVRRVIIYVSGWRRKAVTYSEFVQKRRLKLRN